MASTAAARIGTAAMRMTGTRRIPRVALPGHRLVKVGDQVVGVLDAGR